MLSLSISFIVANECTDNEGICVSSCPATYGIQSFNCEGYPITSFCCVPLGDFPCQTTEGYFCSSTLDFNSPSFSGYVPLDYGLKVSSLACPYSSICYEKVFTKYNGAGNYSLSPGDEIHFENDYIIKYVNFNREASWDTQGGMVTGNSANIAIYSGEVNSSNLGENFVATLANIDNLNKEQTKTFNSGFWLHAEPLTGDSNIVDANVFMGSLSSCTDTDAYTIGNTALELSLGKWGRNYYKKGTATEYAENINGQTTNAQTDSCSNNLLTEYYCDNSKLKLETKKCKCIDDSSCKKGFFDAISEWIKKTFGNLN